MTIQPLGCTIAVAKSPDNTEIKADEEQEGPTIIDLGLFRLIDVPLGGASEQQRHRGSETGYLVKGVVVTNGLCEEHGHTEFTEGEVVWYVEQAAVQVR